MKLPIVLLLALPLAIQAPPTLQDVQTKLSAQDWPGAEATCRAILEQEPEKPGAWYLLGYSLHAQGKLDEALPAHEKAATFPATRAGASYNAGCAYALKGDADKAFEWLRAALAAGFQNTSQMSTDPDLASLREDARFAELFPGYGSEATFAEELDVLRVIDGEAAGDQFGWIGRNAGDVDGDGTVDLLTSAPYKAIGGPNAGRVYVHSGRTGELLASFDGQPNELLGIGIECAGDVDGDGRPDVAAGASGPGYGAGAVRVWSGRTGELLLERLGEAPGDSFGSNVAGCGDWNGDGHDDLIVGAPQHDGPAGADAGRVYVVSGADGRTLATLDGEAAGDRLGSAVDGHAGDRILIVGAPDAGEGDRGRVLVFRGGEGDALELAFAIEAGAEDVQLGRMFVSAVGDVDGDGHVDVYGSDWESNANGRAGSGRIYVHSGRDGKRLLELSGEAPGDGFGIGTCEAGDVDGDGRDDLLVGAWQSAAGAKSGGRCYLHSGADGSLIRTYTCTTPEDTFGFDTTGLGDIDGDGRLDFLITSAYSAVRGPKSGRIVVVAGPESGAR